MVRVLGIAIGDDHFGEGETVEDASIDAFVVVGDVVKDDALAVIEADVDFPILPFDEAVLDGEGDTFRLGDIDRFEVFAVSTFGFDGCWVVIVGSGLIDGPAYWRDVDVYDFLLVAVIDGGKVERVGVLTVVDVWTVVH